MSGNCKCMSCYWFNHAFSAKDFCEEETYTRICEAHPDRVGKTVWNRSAGRKWKIIDFPVLKRGAVGGSGIALKFACNGYRKLLGRILSTVFGEISPVATCSIGATIRKVAVCGAGGKGDSAEFSAKNLYAFE